MKGNAAVGTINIVGGRFKSVTLFEFWARNFLELLLHNESEFGGRRTNEVEILEKFPGLSWD